MQLLLFVFQVTHHTQTYLKEIEMREEGGTPAIVESIRAGLVFQLKEVRTPQSHETSFYSFVAT